MLFIHRRTFLGDEREERSSCLSDRALVVTPRWCLQRLDQGRDGRSVDNIKRSVLKDNSECVENGSMTLLDASDELILGSASTYSSPSLLP